MRILLNTLFLSIITAAPLRALAQDNGAGLAPYRAKIDSLDDALVKLLAERMKVCREVGEYKLAHDMPVVQADRFNAILEKRSRQGAENGMEPEFIKKVFTNIHDESCRQQDELLKSHMTGAYTDGRALTDEELTLFRKTYKGKTKLTPVSVSTQVVAGTNYRFVCKDKAGKQVIVVIFQTLPCYGGKAEVTSIAYNIHST